MIKMRRILLLVCFVVACPVLAGAQDITQDDVARIAEQFNQLSEKDKAILLNVAKQKYDSLSDSEKEQFVNQAKQAVHNMPYENQVLPLEKKLRGDDVPEAMKKIKKKVGSNPQAVPPPHAVQNRPFQKPPLEQAENFIQENESRLSDNQKKGMEHWKNQLEAQEKMHQQYMKYMQQQGRQ